MSGERRKIGSRLERRKVADNLRVGRSVATKLENRRGLRIGNAAPYEFEQGQFAHARVFQVGERSAGEYRLACRALMGHFKKNRVRKARETHGLKLSRAQTELIHPGKLEDRIFTDLRPDQACDFITRIEGLTAAAIDLQRRNAACVGKSGLPRGGKLRDFRRSHIERLQLLNCVVIHSGSVERFGIKRLDGVATDHRQHHGQHDRRKRIAPERKAMRYA